MRAPHIISRELLWPAGTASRPAGPVRPSGQVGQVKLVFRPAHFRPAYIIYINTRILITFRSVLRGLGIVDFEPT